MFVTTGLDLELWVPALLDKAGNPKVTEGGPGYVAAYTGIDLLDVPDELLAHPGRHPRLRQSAHLDRSVERRASSPATSSPA